MLLERDPELRDAFNVLAYNITIDGLIPPLGIQNVGLESQSKYKLVPDWISIDRTKVSLITLGNIEITSGKVTETGAFSGYFMINKNSDFKDQYKREPNQEEMTEVSEVLFERTDELREAILKSKSKPQETQPK